MVGGGPAGIAAAISAAKAGARTLLIERSDVLGGNAGNALVHTICGLYLPAEAGDAQYAHAGFPRRFAELLLHEGAARPAERAGRVHVLPTFPHMLAAVARRLCEETPSLELRTGSILDKADSDEEGISLQIVATDGEFAARAAVAIDASGDAALASMTSAEMYEEPGGSLQNPSFIFRVRGVDPVQIEGFARMRVSHAVARAKKEEKLPPGAGSILLRPGPVDGEAYVTLNVPKPIDYNPLDPTALTDLTDGARRSAHALISYLRAHRDGFEACEVVEWPRRIGVRETRRVAGLQTLNADDVVRGRRCADEVALSTWPIELWNDHEGARFEYPDGPCSIALGTLASRSHPRLGMAGRCMSATHEALGAVRVIGTAMATGEAVGVAAALAADRSAALCEVEPCDVVATVDRLSG